MKHNLVNIDPVLGQCIDPIARQECSCERWGMGSDADGITIGLILSHAQVVGLTPAQHLQMVDQHRTNVGHKQSWCALYSDGTIIGPTVCPKMMDRHRANICFK